LEDNIYKLLGDLILGPPNYDFKHTLSLLNLTDEINIEKLSNDDIASEHYGTFGMTVFPYGHYYTSEGRNFAGDNDSELISLYQEYGFNYESISFGMGATHLGTLLHFVQFTVDKNLPHLRREFIANYLLGWMPTFIIAINEMDSVVYKSLVNYIEHKLLHEWTSLNGPVHLDEIKFQLPEFDIFTDLLNNEKTSMKDIGEYFITPARAGFFLSKPTLLNMAAKLDIPVGFGDRGLIMGDVMREAVNYESLAGLTQILLTYCNYVKGHYHKFPILPIAAIWIKRVEQTEKLINEVATQLKTQSFNA
jgi:hypothetical protein